MEKKYDRKTIALAAVLLGITLLIAACGSGADKGEGGSGDGSGAGSDAPAADEAAGSSSSSAQDGSSSAGAPAGYIRISADEAALMMEEQDNLVIVDVRNQSEYDEGHVPGAICIPVKKIGSEGAEKLEDKDRMILVYCRSGRRSKKAAKKLIKMGYTNVYDFGGIKDWTGEVVSE